MKDINLANINNIHFIGIGGIGISAIARMFVSMGKNVGGQDMQDSEIIHELKNIGISISIGQSFLNIPENTELIVYTIAIEYYDKELFLKLKSQEIPVFSYPEMLGFLSKDKYTIAVCGTHGKTTTTGMISQILKDNGLHPTVVIGSLLAGKTNFIKGDSDIFVLEACEYRRSFLNFNPKILVITNIDEDHLDYYKDIEDIKSAFYELVMKVPSDGFIVCNIDDKNIGDVIKDAKGKIINYADFFNPNIILKIPGIHNKKDGAAAVAVGSILKLTKEQSEVALAMFPGTWRRFEFKGKLDSGTLVYDDYAHHPVEILSTLEGFREIYPKDEDLSAQAGWNITVVFQPHLFSRTKLLIAQFGESFMNADRVLILPIYYAREVDDGSVSSEILSSEINKSKDNSMAFQDFKSTEDYIKTLNLGEKDILVTMGAGEAFKIGDDLLKVYPPDQN